MPDRTTHSADARHSCDIKPDKDCLRAQRQCDVLIYGSCVAVAWCYWQLLGLIELM